PLLLTALPRMPIFDAALEEVLTYLRRCILLRFEWGSNLEPVDSEVPPELVCALARQCFFSGYAFCAEKGELERVTSLREALEDRLREASIRPRALESSLARV